MHKQNPKHRTDIVIDDGLYDTVASVLDGDQPSVLIYITSPPPAAPHEHTDGHLYEMDEPYPSAYHTDLKRDLHVHKRESNNSDMQNGLPLFEKYQFLTPGTFLIDPLAEARIANDSV